MAGPCPPGAPSPVGAQRCLLVPRARVRLWARLGPGFLRAPGGRGGGLGWVDGKDVGGGQEVGKCPQCPPSRPPEEEAQVPPVKGLVPEEQKQDPRVSCGAGHGPPGQCDRTKAPAASIKKLTQWPWLRLRVPTRPRPPWPSSRSAAALAPMDGSERWAPLSTSPAPSREDTVGQRTEGSGAPQPRVLNQRRPTAPQRPASPWASAAPSVWRAGFWLCLLRCPQPPWEPVGMPWPLPAAGH